MAEAAPVAPSPSNGVHKATPAGTAAPANGQQSGTAPPAGDAAAQREAQLKAREEALEKKERVWRDEAKKSADEKKGLGAKLKEYDELRKWKAEQDKLEQLANLNPPEYAKKKWGEKWQEHLNLAAVNGVAPADLIALEMQRMREEFDARLAERDERAAKAAQEAKAQASEAARSEVVADATDFFAAQAAEYPSLATYGDASHVGQMLGAFIESQFRATGKLLTSKEAAEKFEAAEYARLKKVAAAEKYRSQLQEEWKAATLPNAAGSGAPGAPGTPRRTLSNNLTASTPGRAPPVSDEDRERRATEAFNAARRKQG